MNRRPRSVTLISWLFIAVGVLGFANHASELGALNHLESDLVWVLFVRLLAIASGVLMLRRSDWGRWMALAWMAYHVALSAFHSMPELITHTAILVAIASVLLRPGAWEYFRGSPSALAHDSQNR